MKKGFTLIEFLIYFAITMVILMVIGSMGVNILNNKIRLGALEEIEQNARFAAEVMINKIRGAETIITPAVGVSASALELSIADTSKNPTTFDLDGGRIRIKEGTEEGIQVLPLLPSLPSDKIVIQEKFNNLLAVVFGSGLGQYNYLTANEIVFENLEFKNVSYNGTSGTVRIKFTVRKGSIATKDFYVTANIYK